MPEIKNSFTSGKMNKDLDERLIPLGEYRDAMNVQVSTSEGSDVGAIENILGNQLISSDPLVDDGSICVGSIADEANNSLYYLVAGPTAGYPLFKHGDYGPLVGWENQDNLISFADNFLFKDKIFRIKNDNVTPVFIDVHTVKTSFETSAIISANSATYQVTATKGISAGMTCYFFNGPSHALVSVSGLGENDFSGPSRSLYGPLQTTPFYGNRSVTRKVLKAEYDTVSGTTFVTFDKNLEDEHQVNQGGLGEGAYVNSTTAGYNYLVFVKKRLLNFDSDTYVCGLSFLDDFLIWTDNDSEPKKINITRSIEGTHGSGERPTRLIIPDRKIDYETNIVVEEEHISVVKKYPTKKLIIEQELESPTIAESDYNFTQSDSSGVFTLAEVGQDIVENFSSFQNGTEWSTGDELRFLNQLSQANLPDDFDVRCRVKQNLSGLPLAPNIPNVYWPANTYKLEVLSISPLTPVDLSIGPNVPSHTYTNIFDVVRVLDTKSLFEKKFVRFGYRWKYQDGEYSTFSPFTDTVFSPSFFEYNSVLGYNKAMQNYLISIKLREIVSSNIPKDVVQVDLLYIESNASTVYIVDRIRYNDLPTISIGTNQSYNNWQVGSYKIKSELIYSAVPANQILRPWDNVPRKALGLEITGNRIVFANYLQNFNMTNYDDGESYKPTLLGSFDKRWKTGVTANTPAYGKPVLYNVRYFDSFHILNPDINFPRLIEKTIDPLIASPSLKSLRSYQLGFTYLDEYGRETPVFSSDDATVIIPKKQSKEINLLTSKITSPVPSWAKSFKMYVKETSNEYYNLALDRVYKAENGNLWLSFPSSERNKVDEETFLILKKGADSNSLVEPQAKYKIIAIENEAPEFLKTKERLLAEVGGGGGISPPIQHLFNNSTGVAFVSTLTPSSKSFTINAANFRDESSVALEDYGNVLAFDFTDNGGRFSKKYPIVDISLDLSTDEYTIVTETPILASETWMFDDDTAIPYNNTLKLRFYKSITRVKPEFDGKFFVKINGDSISTTFLNTNAGSNVSYGVVAAMNAYYFSDTGKYNIVQGSIGNVGNNADPIWNYYTSSGGTNPHTNALGAVIHSFNDTNLGLESTDGQRDWINALDFGTPTAHSNWFIDEIYYAGKHPLTSNNGGNSVTGNNMVNNFDYGKGIYEENGQQYIEISFSLIGPNACQGDPINNITTNPEINLAKFNDDEIWEVGSALNPNHVDQFAITNQLIPGSKFRIANDNNNTIYEITGNVVKERRYNYAQWALVQNKFDNWLATWSSGNTTGDQSRKTEYEQMWERFGEPVNRRVAYKIPIDKDINSSSGTVISFSSGTSLRSVTAPSVGDAAADGNTPVTIQFIEQRTDDDNDVLLSVNPAIFETEPKEAVDLNLFYEASDAYPTELNIDTIERFVPKGANVTCSTHRLLMDFNEQTFVTGFEQNRFGQLMVKFNIPLRSNPAGASELVFTRADGGYTTLAGDWYTSRTHAIDPDYVSSPPVSSSGSILIPNETAYQVFSKNGAGEEVGLSWFNSYSFGNGVESNRLRDDFNQVFINKGVKVSTTLDSTYQEERRSSGLIYSGIYNSTSGVNSLNQFIQAEKITKDLNPTYGSIQKLFTRNTDLIAFCEDRVLRILANKDAVFNADGNPQLIATANVLGQTMPFSGDYGISKNPESFTFESYRAYFTDAKRGAVLRLSKDGLTNIADYGMSDYFKDNLTSYSKILGSYDAKKNNFNLTLSSYSQKNVTPKTITYSENVKGWTSFKSFIPESAFSMENNYYTFYNGLPYKHHAIQKRNLFYGVFMPSSVEFFLNQAPDTVKSFKTLNYEGSQAKVYEETSGSIDSNQGQGYYNLNSKKGWSVQYIVTDLEKGKIQGNQFIEKEGKWFNYVQGNKKTLTQSNINTSNFNFQGIGRSSSLPAMVLGCMDPNATNTTSGANVDDGSCIYAGCTDANSSSGVTQFIHSITGQVYLATISDGSCTYTGCTDTNANNYNYTCNGVDLTPLGLSITTADNSCCSYATTWDCDTVNGGTMINTVGTGAYTTLLAAQSACPPCGLTSPTGCTDPTMMNYDSTPGLCNDQSLCVAYQFACWDQGQLSTTTTNTSGYDIFAPLQTQLDTAASTTFTDVYGGVSNGVVNQTPYEINSYTYLDVVITSPTFGQTVSVSAFNGLNPIAHPDAGMDCSCVYHGCMDDGYCTDNPDHFDPSHPNFISLLFHLCPDSGGNSYGSQNIGVASPNYAPWATVDDGTCCVTGCTDPGASNTNLSATCDDGSCTYYSCATVPTISGSGPGVNAYGLFAYNSPWFGTPITNTMVPDPVFEEVLETYGSQAGGYLGISFANTLLPPNLDGECCTIGFAMNLNLAITSSTLVGSGGWNSTDTFGSGVIDDLTGLQDFSLPQVDLTTGLTTSYVGYRTRYLLIHLQNITSFIHSETDSNSDYFGLDMLDTFSSSWTGTTFGAGVTNISLKSLPLSGVQKLDLSAFTILMDLEITDCGIADIILPSSQSGHPNSGLIVRLIITNNYLPTTDYNNAGKTSNQGGNANDSFEGHSYVGYSGINPNLPDSITGANGGENLNYNGSQDKLGPVRMHHSSSGNYYPSYTGSHNWDHTTGGSGGAVDANSIIRLINLPSLKHFHVDFVSTTVIDKMQNVYGTSTHEPQHRAAFTTKGCHPDLEIHVGSASLVNYCEQAYGTARQYIDEPNTTQLNPNWSQAGETFFLEYFEPGHRFTT